MHRKHVVALIVLGLLSVVSFGGFVVDETTPALGAVVALCRSLAMFGTVMLASQLVLRYFLNARGSGGLMPPTRIDDLDGELHRLIDQERGQQGMK